jgi:FixJ family two-component response regulator
MSSSAEFVAVVDDDDAVRELICLILRSLKLPVVDYADPMEFLKAGAWRQCLCLVLDLRLPGMSGIEVQRRLKAEGASLPVIFITGHADVPLAVAAMRDGAVDFLQKPLKEQELVDLVQRCVQNSRQQRQQERGLETVMARLACLTPREREVFDQLVAGRRSKHIADTLGLTLKTIEEYRSKVLHKMHVTSTAELLSQVAPLLPANDADQERR